MKTKQNIYFNKQITLALAFQSSIAYTLLKMFWFTFENKSKESLQHFISNLDINTDFEKVFFIWKMFCRKF